MELPVNEIICGDCIEVMRGWPDNCVDTVITDPPYGLGFMGKEWDTFAEAKATHKEGHYITKAADGSPVRHQKGFSAASAAGLYDHSRNAEFQQWFTVWATEVLRIAKPGAIMLVFGGTRTYHRLTCAIEDAGWQIRDCMMWLYGSGFPKSHDISKAIDKSKGAERKVVGSRKAHDIRSGNLMEASQGKGRGSMEYKYTEAATDLAKQWDGWGTALKPAWEPIIVAMKPLDGTFAQNAEKWGVAGLNIDGGRIGFEGERQPAGSGNPCPNGNADIMSRALGNQGNQTPPQGRWPANVILDEEAGKMLDEQSGESKSTIGMRGIQQRHDVAVSPEIARPKVGTNSLRGHTDSGGASRFFYCAKASRAERNAGLEGMPLGEPPASARSKPAKGRQSALGKPRQNTHPTVKPLRLMEYLCKLTMTPTGGIVLDLFAGSGTTGMACVRTGRDYVLIEKDESYCEIANKRIAAAKEHYGLFKK